VIGLGAAGAALLAAMGVLAMRGSKNNDPQTLTIPTTQAPAASDTTAFGPLATSPTTPAASAAPTAATGGTPTATAVPRPTTSPTAPHTATATATATSKPAPPAADACDACEKAAQGGNISVAIQHYERCSDEGKKKECLSHIKNNAAATAQAASNSHNCEAVRTIEAAANGIGANSAKLKNIAKNCK
jgi:hypothetical protein